MTPTGYQIAAELCRGEQYVMYRGRREADRVPVLLKSPLRRPARAAQIEGLRRQFALLSDLALPGVPRAYELVRSDGTCWLVLEDAGVVPLASLLAAGPIELSTFFHLALQLAAPVAAPATTVLRTVTLPLVLPGVISGAVLAFARALGEFGATLTFAGSLQGVTRTLPVEIYLQRDRCRCRGRAVTATHRGRRRDRDRFG